MEVWTEQQMEITALITYILINQMRLLRGFVIDHLLFSYSVGFALWTGKKVSLVLVHVPANAMDCREICRAHIKKYKVQHS